MTFRSRMSLVVGLLTAIALGAAFAAVSAAFNALQRKQLDQSLLAVARAEAAEAPRNTFRFSGGPGPATNDVGPLTAFGVILGDDGATLSATAPFDVHPPPRDALSHRPGEVFDLWHASGHLRAVVLAIPGHPEKRVLIATSGEDLDGDEAFLHRAMFSAFLVSVLWVGFVAYWMGGRLVRDHQAVAAAARRVARGDLTTRVQLHSRDPEVIQLFSDVNDMIERLEELVGSQQRFVAHAAHELRSPLAALSGELQHALRRERDVDSYKAAIQSALSATRRLTTLAEDLLALARLEGDTPAPAEAIEIGAVLERTKAAVQPLSSAHGVTVVERSAEGWIADRNGDTSRLLRNLLENAIRYSPSGARVRVEVTLNGAMAEIAVSDGGPGVDSTERQQIFTPFFRGKGSAGTSGSGSGLGLGIAREIARSHGGDIELDGAFTAGARFVVSLPLVESQRAHSTSPSTASLTG